MHVIKNEEYIIVVAAGENLDVKCIIIVVAAEENLDVSAIIYTPIIASNPFTTPVDFLVHRTHRSI